MMIYNGKKVFDTDEFDCGKATIGDYVSEQVVDDLMYMLPPVTFTSTLFQVGESYTQRYDTEKGKYRTTFITFKRVSNKVWEYCGDCFAGEHVKHGCSIPVVGRSVQ